MLVFIIIILKAPEGQYTDGITLVKVTLNSGIRELRNMIQVNSLFMCIDEIIQ